MDLVMMFIGIVGFMIGLFLGCFIENKGDQKEYRIIKTTKDEFVIQCRSKFLFFKGSWECVISRFSLGDAINALPLNEQLKIKGYETVNLEE